MFSVDSNSAVGEFGMYGLSECENVNCKMTLWHERPGSKAVELTFNRQIMVIKVSGYYKLFVSVYNSGNWDTGSVYVILKKNNKWLIDA